MPTDIEQIEDLIIAEIQRTDERIGFPVIGINDCTTWAGQDIQEMLQSILSDTAARVIYAGSKQGALKVIGGGSGHDETLMFRVAVIVSSLRSRTEGSRSGYAYLESMKKCFAKFSVAPLRGFLWNISDELLYVGNGKHVYGFEIERSVSV